MKIWECLRCKHVVAADEMPILRWDDGHSCFFREQECEKVETTLTKVNDVLYKAGLVTQVDRKHLNILIFLNHQHFGFITLKPDKNDCTEKATIVLADGSTHTYERNRLDEIAPLVIRRTLETA